MLIHRQRNWFAFTAIAAGVVYPACSTKAVGVDECRRIEYARCEAAPNCPAQFSVTDVEQCKLFYRDHCLHGLGVSAAPSGNAVKNCIVAIQDLATCAAEFDGAAALLANCATEVTTTNPKITKACKLLAAPEAIAECSFLAADSSSGGEAGATSTVSSGGSSSESGGTAGFGGLTL